MLYDIHVARVYDPVGPDEGQRVLVDRLWPRGIRKTDPRVGTWYPDAAPSPDLRRWYNHDPDLFGKFGERYRTELVGPLADGLAHLRELATIGPLTLVTASKDVNHSEAAVLAHVLQDTHELHH